MANGDGLRALETIRQEMPGIKVVMLSTYDNPTYVARAVALGADDYLLKGSSRDEIIATIRTAAEGKSPAPTSALGKVAESMRARRAAAQTEAPLTRRETQVLRHLALGLNNKEIGQSLGISVDTVKEHVQNILRKISLNDRTQAAVWAIRRGLVQ
jgi:DNA-binding NarL/FixJ family response regulator